MRPASLATATIAVTLALALGLGGCGASPAGAVRAKVEQFATATRTHDYATICTQVLAPNLLDDISVGGLTCEEAMRTGLEHVRGARLVVGEIHVSGNTASVVTASQARGERSTLATVELVKTAGGWRISSLGDV